MDSSRHEPSLEAPEGHPRRERALRVLRRTGAPAVTGSFGIAYEDAPGNDFLVLDRSIDFLESHAWLAVGTDSLWLGGVMEGGYESRYGRVP